MRNVPVHTESCQHSTLLEQQQQQQQQPAAAAAALIFDETNDALPVQFGLRRRNQLFRDLLASIRRPAGNNDAARSHCPMNVGHLSPRRTAVPHPPEITINCPSHLSLTLAV